jgi:uncharacterized repeat protein (TIGR03803 family)
MKSKFVYLLCIICSLYCIDALALTNTGTPSFQTLYNFGTNNSDGGYPLFGLFQAQDGTIYGTTSTVVINGKLESEVGGTIFSITPSGIEKTVFSYTNQTLGNMLSTPLIQVGSSIYGGSLSGGESGFGNVFKLSNNGNVSNVVSFNYDQNGAGVISNLVSDANGNIYGTTNQGGKSDFGTVFKITPDNKLTVLHSFTGKSSDGINPQSLIMGRDGLIYGTTVYGGYGAKLCFNPKFPDVVGCGTIFSINPATGEYKLLYRFLGTNDQSVRRPTSIVFGLDNNIYGLAVGGKYGTGAFYKYDLTSHKLTTQYSFKLLLDGMVPNDLIQSSTDGNFYGTTVLGGDAHDMQGYGVVFQFPYNCMTGPKGCQEVVLHAFTDDDGSLPAGIFEANDGNLYGVTRFGGTLGFGTIFTIKK